MLLSNRRFLLWNLMDYISAKHVIPSAIKLDRDMRKKEETFFHRWRHLPNSMLHVVIPLCIEAWLENFFFLMSLLNLMLISGTSHCRYHNEIQEIHTSKSNSSAETTF